MTTKQKRHLALQDIIGTEQDLFLLRQAMLPTFERMGMYIDKISQFPVRFGEDWEFGKTNDAFYTKRNIVIKRGNKVIKVLGDLAHEYGHEVTLTGSIGTKTNLIGEITAYNFQKIFIKNFNNNVDMDLKIVNIEPFFKSLKDDAVHTIALALSFIPLGMLIKPKYKTNGNTK